jgi:flagellar FliL protein
VRAQPYRPKQGGQGVPEEAAVPEAEQKPAKSGAVGKIGKILLIVLLAVVSSAGGGFVSFMLIKRTLPLNAETTPVDEAEVDEQEKIAEMLEKSAVLPLEPFVVNLADPEAPRYLKIKISLMVDDKTKEKELVENQALQLKIRDVILQSLTAKTSRDLINEDGKNKLRHEIQEKITVYFKEPKLVEVMFTEFVIQL